MGLDHANSLASPLAGEMRNFSIFTSGLTTLIDYYLE